MTFADKKQSDAQTDLVSQAAVRIQIKREGWYRVTQPELVRAGFNPKADPRLLQLLVDGREVPLLVRGEKDGIRKIQSSFTA